MNEEIEKVFVVLEGVTEEEGEVLLLAGGLEEEVFQIGTRIVTEKRI